MLCAILYTNSLPLPVSFSLPPCLSLPVSLSPSLSLCLSLSLPVSLPTCLSPSLSLSLCLSDFFSTITMSQQNVRMKEVRREEAAINFIKNNFNIPESTKIEVKSSWGPYTTTAGTAKHTAIPGTPVKVTAGDKVSSGDD